MLQAVASYTADDGTAVHRVVTRRLHAGASAGAYLRGVRPVPAAVLTAKGVVREAQRAGAAGDRAASAPLLRSLGAALSCDGRCVGWAGRWVGMLRAVRAAVALPVYLIQIGMYATSDALRPAPSGSVFPLVP